MRFSAHIDAGRTTEEFRSARVQINQRVRTGIQNCVERIALPRVRAFAKAPAEVRAALIARATGTSGYITTGGSRKLDRILGLLNFGGTVRGTIRPKQGRSGKGHAPALKTPNGYFAADPRPASLPRPALPRAGG
jgi:hypothetical protein